MPTNATLWGSTVTVEVSSAAPDADPVWVDISNSVSFRDGQLTVGTGRQTDLTGDDPSQLTLAIRDDDHAYATGNLIRQARRIRKREHFGLYTIDLIDAYIQVPTTTVPMDLADGSQAEITLSISAVDKLARLRSARKFIGTLAEYIRFTGGTGLAGYYPCHEAVLPFRDVTRQLPDLTVNTSGAVSFNAQPTEGFVSVIPGGAGPVLADDQRVVSLTATRALFVGLLANLNAPVLMMDTALASLAHFDSTPLTAIAWYNPDLLADRSCSLLTIATVHETFIVSVSSTGVLGLFVGGDLTGSWASATIPVLRHDSWTAIGIHYEPANSLAQLWVDGTSYPIALAGTPPVSDRVLTLTAGQYYSGGFGHLQAYISSAYSVADYRAQIEMARLVLDGQSTSDRVGTVLDYAAVPRGIRDIDQGVAVMSPASLAGKDPLTCLEEARATERGRLFISGDGRVQFRNRIRDYNI